MITLGSLLEGLPGTIVRGVREDLEITGLSADSRTVQPGYLFIALRGENVDGHKFVPNAIAAGAAAILADRTMANVHDVPLVLVSDTRIALSRIAASFYGEPSRSLRIAGITGTNGKTTTTHLVRAILDGCGLRCGYVGTLGASYREWTRELENTTPLPIELHETLARMKELGAQAVAMEVSSHALALHRVDDIKFEIGAFTNLTRDHLDFHKTTEAYASAKHRLFEMCEHAVLDVDDEHGCAWAAELEDEDKPLTTYAIDSPDADLHARDIVLRPDGSSFVLSGVKVEVPMPGRFNVQNALCALAIAHAMGCDLAKAAAALKTAPPVPGRMERYAQDDITAIVDYAHTPDALANVLRAARETLAVGGKLICVFGCGGDRDKGKRPEMGAVARALADEVIITNDNPRSEHPMAIAQAIVSGAPDAHIELNRRSAIRYAIGRAHAGDVVVVAGKGHETYQIIGDTRGHFDDRDEVRTALQLRATPAQV
jgi:UDP-N-acetylmuramoyl-L-alanyl-D-glutamate--2,6-diaminopimelate ligase